MKKVVTIAGMTCNHCVMHVRKELQKLEGVKSLDVEIGRAVIEGESLDNRLIKSAIAEAGYETKDIKDE